MKTLQKITVILLIAICVLAIMPQNIVMAADDLLADIQIEEPTNNTSGFKEILGRVLGFLRVASGLAAVVMIAITGFNYIISTPEGKGEMLKKMTPILIGLVLVFGAVSIASLILGIVGR